MATYPVKLRDDFSGPAGGIVRMIRNIQQSARSAASWLAMRAIGSCTEG